MEQLEYPVLETWEERRRWFEALEAERAEGGAPSRLSEQACALMVDLQATFCVGAWAATIVLAAIVVDSQGRFRRADPGLQQELAWLRLTRNALVHEDPREPALTIEDQWTNRRAWERDAKRAVAIALAALYPTGAVAEIDTRSDPHAPDGLDGGFEARDDGQDDRQEDA